MVELCPPRDRLKSQPPGPQNVTLFENRVLADVITVVKMKSYWIRVAPNPMAGVPRRQTCTRVDSHVTPEAEIGVMHLLDNCQHPAAHRLQFLVPGENRCCVETITVPTTRGRGPNSSTLRILASESPRKAQGSRAPSRRALLTQSRQTRSFPAVGRAHASGRLACLHPLSPFLSGAAGVERWSSQQRS